MEKRINKKFETYISEFKDAIRGKISTMNIAEKEKINELIEYIYEYERLSFTKDDFAKRKRVKNSIPNINRCNACRANGEQCTRRRKENSDFCGTHFKGTPHGLTTTSEESNSVMKSVEIFAEDIQGIIYYIDRFNNVYKNSDILEGITNPKIIGSYTNLEDKGYQIKIM
jgi:hypothetical protein